MTIILYFFKNLCQKCFKVVFHSSINDAPANYYVLCVMSHNAHSGCRKCDVEEDTIELRTCFDDDARRMDVKFDSFHEQKLALAELPIGLMSLFSK